MRSLDHNLVRLDKPGFDLLAYFIAPEESWWTEYLGPLEQEILKLRDVFSHDDALLLLVEEQRKVDFRHLYSEFYGSVFFIAHTS